MADLPDNMTAIEIARKGGPEVLVPRNVARPRLSDRQILIKVAAAGVNGPDVQQREGHYPAPKGHSEIPGLEVAGAVAGAGSSATRFKLGDPVMALVNGDGCA